MQLEWLDDILAVMDAGSLAEAAKRRFLTQSAFTRRIRSIEDKIGAELFDRSRKPVAIASGVKSLEPELRELSARLRRLKYDLRSSAEGAGGGVTFVCQHAITATISPWIVQVLTAQNDASVRVRSGNRDECLMLLLSGDADFAVTYEDPDDHSPLLPQGFETADLGVDLLVPAGAPELLRRTRNAGIPVILYPPEVFLGRIFHQCLAPRLSDSTLLLPKAETALTLAACEYALCGIGVAWLPLTLIRRHLGEGRLQRADWLPEHQLKITMIRLAGRQGGRNQEIWRKLPASPGFPSDL